MCVNESDQADALGPPVGGGDRRHGRGESAGGELQLVTRESAIYAPKVLRGSYAQKRSEEQFLAEYEATNERRVRRRWVLRGKLGMRALPSAAGRAHAPPSETHSSDTHTSDTHTHTHRC